MRKHANCPTNVLSELFLFKFDLKIGYHHVEIFQEHRKYLSFYWDFDDGVNRYYSFSVLPFGLSSVPYVFTKLLRTLKILEVPRYPDSDILR